MEALGEWLTINRTAIEIQHSHLEQEVSHRKAKAYLEILPNKKHTFCINLHAYLKPKAVLNPLKRYALTVNFGNMLAWKRRSGYTTDFGMESYANIHNALATQNTKSPYFDFSPQQLVAHKNRSCG